jgi:hypothetical protein
MEVMSAWVEYDDYWSIRGRECEITLKQRPHY